MFFSDVAERPKLAATRIGEQYVQAPDLLLDRAVTADLDPRVGNIAADPVALWPICSTAASSAACGAP